jgi:hypothetical protein
MFTETMSLSTMLTKALALTILGMGVVRNRSATGHPIKKDPQQMILRGFYL